MITSELLAQIFPGTPRKLRDRFIAPLNNFLILYRITTYRRVCAFLATGGVETDFLRTLTEYASGADYEGRVKDLGNTQKGDGRKYKGSGFFQTTGRRNFFRVLIRFVKKLTGVDYSNNPAKALAEADRLGVNFIDHPELLRENVEMAIEAACIFWEENHLEAYADKGDFKNLNSIVNTGAPGRTPNQWSKRNMLYSLCLRRVPQDISFERPAAVVEPQSPVAVPEPVTVPPMVPASEPTTDQPAGGETSASLKDLGSKILAHCPNDTKKNILTVISLRILTGVTVIWQLGLHGQIFLIALGLIVLAVVGYAIWKYSYRIVGWAKELVDCFIN